jgi:outer membrane protein W
MRTHNVNYLSIAAAVLALAATAGSAQTYRDVYQLGRPDTRFSAQPEATLTALQSQFVTYRSDLEAVLRLGGWDGDTEALFRTVAEAEPGSATVSARAVSRGETFHWMAYRKNGEPAIQRNVRWAGDQPFAAWQIQFVSNGAVHTFMVPHACLNLAYYGTPIPVDAPGAPMVPGVPGAAPMATPGTAAPMAPAPAAGPEAPAEAEPMAPTGAPGAGAAPVPEPTPDSPAAPPPAAPETAMAPVARGGTTASDREGRWTLRAYGASFRVDDDKWVGDLLGLDERSQMSATKGVGWGLDAEYHFTPRLGVAVGAFTGRVELHWMFDFLDTWGMDESDLDFTGYSLGLNYHLTPNKRFDFFVGPFISLWQFDRTKMCDLGFDIFVDPDNETALGALAGVDVPISAGSPWIATAAVRYTPLSVNDSPIDFDLDPLTVTVGFGYRF